MNNVLQIKNGERSELLCTTHYLLPTKAKKLRFFSLIELLIVVGIIGALTALILPSFNLDEVSVAGDVNQTVNAKEISTIQKAFLKFYDDVVPSDTQLAEFAKYGLTPLMENVEPGKSGDWFDEWNPDRKKGWRGSYLSPEGRVKVNTGEKAGQSLDDSGAAIPVVYNSSGYHYRVMIPNEKGKTTAAGSQFLCLVDFGANGSFDLTTFEVDTKTGELDLAPTRKKKNGRKVLDCDDQVIRLLPFD